MKNFLCIWFEPSYTSEYKECDFSFFTEDNGFDVDDILKISKLEIGESLKVGVDLVVICIKDKDIILTKSQQEIIDSLISEFEKVNSAKQVSIESIIDIDAILSEKQELIDYNNETELINKSVVEMQNKIINECYEKLMPAFTRLEINLRLCTDNFGFRSIAFGDFRINVVKGKGEEKRIFGRTTNTRYAPSFAYHLVTSNAYSYESMNALISSENFTNTIKRLVKV